MQLFVDSWFVRSPVLINSSFQNTLIVRAKQPCKQDETRNEASRKQHMCCTTKHRTISCLSWFGIFPCACSWVTHSANHCVIQRHFKAYCSTLQPSKASYKLTTVIKLICKYAGTVQTFGHDVIYNTVISCWPAPSLSASTFALHLAWYSYIVQRVNASKLRGRLSVKLTPSVVAVGINQLVQTCFQLV